MKISKHIVSASLVILFSTTGCNDFLDKAPLDELTESTAFITYDNFKTYSWKLYETFSGFPTDGGYTPSNISSEYNSDNMINAQTGGESDYAYQLKSVPSTSSSWNFSYIRNVNIMLQNIDKSSMNDTEKRHWRSVGYFFRALRYFDMIVAYGDVPWIDKVLSDTDLEALQAPRTPRAQVAQNMLEDLKYAEENIKPDGDGNNTINVHVVRALISRFGLYEGTWRKYHNQEDAETYLRVSAEASAKLVKDFPTLISNYDEIFNSEELVGQPGIILAKQYATDLVTHSITRVIRSSAWYADVTKDAVDSYLCTDGRPISTSKVYEGDKDIYAQFRNRDRRLYYTVTPPYKVKITGSAGTSFTWDYTDNSKDREYIDLMKTISSEKAKYLPISNYVGYTVHAIPHFRNYPNGQGFCVSQLGFYFWKYYNRHVDNMGLRTSTVDYPLFRMSLGVLTINALTAVDSVLIPIQCEFYALEGVGQLINTIQLVKKSLNKSLDIEGVLMTMYDYRTNLSNEVYDEAKKFFNDKVYDATIARNIRLAEAPSFGLPIMLYDDKCKGAIAYKKFAKEFLSKQ